MYGSNHRDMNYLDEAAVNNKLDSVYCYASLELPIVICEEKRGWLSDLCYVC